MLATLGAIGGRFGMGTVLDVVGPRFGNAIIMLMFAPPVFCMSLIKDAAGFQCVRFFIGMSLCCFVACQFWVGSMFNVKIVGTANAITAGECFECDHQFVTNATLSGGFSCLPSL